MGSLKRGRPLLLGKVLDKKVKHFLLQLRKKSGVVNTVVAVATAKALIAGSRDHFKFIDLESTTWAKRLFKQMGFCKVLQKHKFQNWLNEKQNYF